MPPSSAPRMIRWSSTRRTISCRCPSRRRRLPSAAAVRRLREPLEHRRQHLELVLPEPLAKQIADARQVILGRDVEALLSLVRDLRVDDARVRFARLLLHEAATLEAVEQTRDPRRREEDVLRQI